MPPRAGGLNRKYLTKVVREAYVCPSCLARRNISQASLRSTPAVPSRNHRPTEYSIALRNEATAKHLKGKRSPFVHRNLSLGALASSTAINAPSTVSQEVRELHQRLLYLQEKASSYVNLSQVQLALRSLESNNPVVRVAFLCLGSDGQAVARQLVRVLLSDALEPEQPWETALRGEGDGRNILLRYGDYTDTNGVQSSTSLVRTMNIPSPLLKSLNLEIMVTPLNTKGLVSGNSHEVEDTILVPALTISNSNAGRVGFVRHPVHQALIIAQGTNGILEYGRLPSSIMNQALVRAALSLPLRSASGMVNSEAESHAVDVDLASHALGLFRDSKANGAVFSEEWQTSRIPSISAWLKASTDSSSTPDGLKPAVRALLEHILTTASTAVDLAQSSSTEIVRARSVPETSRAGLRDVIAVWSKDAHRDLQSNLDSALDSATWRKTAWWRLFWRIDEVSISASDVLRRGWLVETEQTLAFLSGRLLETGVATEKELKIPSDTVLRSDMEQVQKIVKHARNQPQQHGSLSELLDIEPMLERRQQESGLNVLFDPPWPQTINIARQQMLHQVVPSMHKKAQVLLLSVLSTIGVSGGLAGALLAASGGAAFYEAGALGALGLIWSLRRLQKKWGKERESFVQIAREDGRSVLVDVEKRLRSLVKDGGRVEVSDGDRKEWEEARSAIRACRESLATVTKT